MTRILWGSVVALGAFLASCSNQEEGERCDLANGHNDCEPGLECKSLQSLTGAGTGAICCPRPEDGANVAACRPGSISFDDADDDADDSSDADDTDDTPMPDAATPADPPASNPDAATPADPPISNPDAATPPVGPDAAADSGSDAG